MKGLQRFGKHCYRELLIQGRQLGRLLDLAVFFIMVLVFFPLAMPADALVLRQIAPGLVWIALLLVLILAAEGLFHRDYEEGVLEQYCISGHSLAAFVLAKIVVHWLIIVLPLLFFCPFLAILFQFSSYESFVLLMALVLAMPALLSLSALAAAFSLSRQQKSLLMALLVMPLALPLMIFGSGSMTAAMQGFPVLPYAALLCAFSLLALAFLPLTIAAVLRVAIRE